MGKLCGARYSIRTSAAFGCLAGHSIDAIKSSSARSGLTGYTCRNTCSPRVIMEEVRDSVTRDCLKLLTCAIRAGCLVRTKAPLRRIFRKAAPTVSTVPDHAVEKPVNGEGAPRAPFRRCDCTRSAGVGEKRPAPLRDAMPRTRDGSDAASARAVKPPMLFPATTARLTDVRPSPSFTKPHAATSRRNEAHCVTQRSES
eukprot:scaffold122216_cov35-Tisochrysis_lutea.AAC.3